MLRWVILAVALVVLTAVATLVVQYLPDSETGSLVPVNTRTGKNVGILGQVHFYLDDIAPRFFTWTPFHGVLGPTFPR